MSGVSAGARDGLRSVTRGTALTLLGTVGFVAESFVYRVLLVRTLSPMLWGEFSYAIALAGLLTAFGSLGLTSALARSLPYESDDGERRRMIATAYRIGVPGAVAAGALLAFLQFGGVGILGEPEFGLTLLYFGVATVFTLLANLVAAVFQGFEDALPNALFVQVVNPLLFIAFLGVATVGPLAAVGYAGVLAAYAASAGVSLLGLVLYARRTLPRYLPAGPRPPGISRRLVGFAAPLFFVSVLGFVASNGDTLVVGAFDQGTVGYYTADLALARLILIGVSSLGYIFLPVTTRLVRSGDRDAVRIMYATATKWMVLTSVPFFLVFFFYPAPVLTLVYGGGYAGATAPLQLLVVGSLALTVVGPASVAQVAYGHTRLLLYNTLLSAGVDLGLAVALVPTFGLSGAAVAWAASTALYPILSMAELAFLESVHPFRRHYVVPLLAASVPLAIAFAVVPYSFSLLLLPLLVIAAAGLFLVAVVLTGSIDTGDRLLLEAVERIVGRRLPFVRGLYALSRRGRE